MLGLDTCNADSECWTGKCVAEGDYKRCARVMGSETAEPMLKCAVALIDPDLWREVSRIVGINPAIIGPDLAPPSRAAWSAAVQAFQQAVAIPSCASTSGHVEGWCTIGIAKDACMDLADSQHRDWQRRFQWIEDETNSGGGGANNDREGGESNANKNYVDEARMKFEDEIERVARELEAKKLSSKSSTWAGKSTPATAPPSNTANPLRMLVGNSKQQQVVAVAAAAEIAAAPTPNPTSIAPPSVRREHLTTQQLIEIQLHQQQEQHKRFEQILHQQRAHAKQHQQEEGETGAELLKTRKKRGGRRVREAEERRLLKQTLGATTTTTMPPGAVVKVLSKDPSSAVKIGRAHV